VIYKNRSVAIKITMGIICVIMLLFLMILSANFGARLSNTTAELEGNKSYSPLEVALTEHMRSCSIQVLSDSTANSVNEWPTILGGLIATQYEDWNVEIRFWNDATQDYDSARMIQEGIMGPRYLDCSTGTITRCIPPAYSPYLSGIIDVRMKLSLGDWTPGSLTPLAGKSGGDEKCGWYIGISNIGRPFFTYSTDGDNNTLTQVTSNCAPNVQDGVPTWIRWVFTPDDGSGNNTLETYQSIDGVTWSMLGNTITTAGVLTIYNNTCGYEVGGVASGIGDSTAKIYEIQIRDGLNGPIVAPIMPDNWQPFLATSSAVCSGAPTFTIFVGSYPGATCAYLSDNTRIKKLAPPCGQCITIISVSHNEGANFGRSFIESVEILKSTVLAQIPMSPVVLLTQNPQTIVAEGYREQANRRLDLIIYSEANNLRLIDVYKELVDYGEKWPTDLMKDPVHPNTTGQAIWAATVYNALFQSIQ